MQWKSIESVQQYLSQIPKFKSSGEESANFNLRRFESFCEKIGNPQQSFPAIHVAGTNGKGSTCQILAHVLETAGYNTGLFTSPHIQRFSERFQINHQEITDGELVHFFRQYVDLIEEHELTYFEICTAIAFWWFARQQVDITIVEVGLGGRLDATNIITPVLSIITSISLDHTRILGDTIGEIAAEKSGIIKEEVPVVTGDLSSQAKSVVSDTAQGRDAVIKESAECRYVSSGNFMLQTSKETSMEITTGFRAPVQAQNIALAWTALQQIDDQFPVSQSAFRQGMQNIESTAGRFEQLRSNYDWYFDGAHNIEAIKALKSSLKTMADIDAWTLVFSIMEDKLTTEVVNKLSEFNNIYYYPLDVERAATFDDIKGCFPTAVPFPEKHVQRFLTEEMESELVIFAGSLYFYSLVREWTNNIDQI